MAAFEFQALDANGRQRKGVLEGDSPRQIRQQLREKGWAPLNVTAVVEKEQKQAAAMGGFAFKRGLSAMQLSLLTRQLATLVQAGLPIEEALRGVAEQSETGRIKSMILAVRAGVVEGMTLADSLARFPHVFDTLYRATVAAGEQAGHLDGVLERLAEYTERRQALQQDIGNAMLYPCILILLSIAIVVGLLTYVVPQVVGVFEDTGQQLPVLTRVLIGSSEWLQQYGLYVLVVIVALVLFYQRSMRQATFRMTMHRAYLTLPLVGKLIRGMNTARFTQTLSILTASGVPLLESLRIAGEVLTNDPMRQAVAGATAEVREGSSLHLSLRETKQFPPLAIHMIASGENSGELDSMLERVATHQERELSTTIATVLGLFEPLLILSMGGIVLMIVMAILLPIFELNQLVG